MQLSLWGDPPEHPFPLNHLATGAEMAKAEADRGVSPLDPGPEPEAGGNYMPRQLGSHQLAANLPAYSTNRCRGRCGCSSTLMPDRLTALAVDGCGL